MVPSLGKNPIGEAKRSVPAVSAMVFVSFFEMPVQTDSKKSNIKTTYMYVLNENRFKTCH
jgi:hypothetical protein